MTGCQLLRAANTGLEQVEGSNEFRFRHLDFQVSVGHPREAIQGQVNTYMCSSGETI